MIVSYRGKEDLERTSLILEMIFEGERTRSLKYPEPNRVSINKHFFFYILKQGLSKEFHYY